MACELDGKITQTLDSVLLSDHKDFHKSMGFQMLVVSVHFLDRKNSDGNYLFSNMSEAFMDYTTDKHFSPQYRLVLEALAHRHNPSELMSHKALHLHSDPNEFVKDECWYLGEALDRFPGYSDSEVAIVKDLLKECPDSEFKQSPGKYLPSAYAFHDVMKRTTDLGQYAA